MLEEITNNVLQRVDEFEEKIKLIQILSKQYDELKEDIKSEMVKVGKELNVEQLKWTTPKGLQITLSLGKPAEYESQIREEFNMMKFQEEQPDMYNKYLEKNVRDVVTKNGTYNRLTITTPKEK